MNNTPAPTDPPKANNAAGAGCMTRFVRLRVGSRFWMDFQGWTWPDCPHSDSEIVFVATPARSTVGKSTLRGKGFGNPRPHYGNGSILANDSDLIDLPNKV
jgi:hypothetical protein